MATLFRQGNSYAQVGQTTEAESIYLRVLAFLEKTLGLDHPHVAMTLVCLADIYQAQDRYADAESLYRRALGIWNTALVEDGALIGTAMNNLAELFRKQGRYAEAEPLFLRSLKIYEKFYGSNHENAGIAMNNLAAFYQEQRRYAEAMAICQIALAIRPDSALAHYGLGNAQMSINRCAEAILSYQKALRLDPCLVQARFSQSFALLALGKFERGWEQLNEWLQATNGYGSSHAFAQPLWRGSHELTGKTIFLHNDGGLGDALQFIRYVPLLAARGAQVVLEVQPSLKALVASLAGVGVIVGQGDAVPAFDCHVSLTRLPFAFGTTLQSIPAQTPYLHAGVDRISKWRTVLGERKGPRVGLTWFGRQRYDIGRHSFSLAHRSIALANVLPLMSAPGMQFVSLQKELCEGDAEILQTRPEITRLDDQLDDFADTAAVVSLLDLVITVDTSIAHLAGALGRPVWILLPFDADWRWLLERDDSPWYPTARLFRQPIIGDWGSVIASVKYELDAWRF